MNEANVAALARLLKDDPLAAALPLDPAWCREIAERLAARGVLVPSALTDDEAEAARPALFGELAMGPDDCAAFRASLERLARGEPA